MFKTRKSGGIPSQCGYNIRSIKDHCHNFKAEEWRNWALPYSPIYLENVLPEPFYTEYISLVRAVVKAIKFKITPGDIE